MNHIDVIKSEADGARADASWLDCVQLPRDPGAIANLRSMIHGDGVVTITELAGDKVMHGNMDRLPARVILENHRMSGDRRPLPAANTSGDFTGERGARGILIATRAG